MTTVLTKPPSLAAWRAPPRNFLVSQPAALHIYLSHPVVSPAAIERMNTMLDVLRRTGADEQAARRAYGALHTYTIGFAALEASRSRSAPSASEDADGLAQQLDAYTTTEQFRAGLRYLLDGISGSARGESTAEGIEEQPGHG